MVLRYIPHNSNIELTIIVTVIACLIIFAVIKLLPFTARAEQIYFENTLAQLNRIITISTANHIMRGHISEVEQLNNGNPFTLFKGKGLPGYYIGEIDNPDSRQLKGYIWYFDKSDNTLVYNVENKRFFSSSEPGISHIKFKLNLKYTDNNKNGVFNKGIDEVKGVILVPQNDYEWLFSQ